MNELMFPKPVKRIKEKKPLKKATKPIAKKSKQSVAKAKLKAWSAFSLYVRLSAADYEGYVKCITCPAKKHYKEIQAGHFIPGRTNAVLFSEEGVHPQCYQCNVGKKGNWPAYYEWMLGMYGQEVINQLLRRSREPVQYTLQDYLDIATKYKTKLEEEIGRP